MLTLMTLATFHVVSLLRLRALCRLVAGFTNGQVRHADHKDTYSFQNSPAVLACELVDAWYGA